MVTTMPQINHENQPPFCHFVMLLGTSLVFDECFLLACFGVFFLLYRVFANVCKIGPRLK